MFADISFGPLIFAGLIVAFICIWEIINRMDDRQELRWEQALAFPQSIQSIIV